MLEIDFSKNGEGKAFLTTNGKSIRILECKNPKIKAGEYGTAEDEGEILVQLNFNRIESVEVFMHKLMFVLDNIQNEKNLTLGR